MELPTLEEAKMRFPIGTIFHNGNLGCGCYNNEVIGDNFYYDGGNIMINRNSIKNNDSNYTIYKRGKWADIEYNEPKYEIY